MPSRVDLALSAAISAIDLVMQMNAAQLRTARTVQVTLSTGPQNPERERMVARDAPVRTDLNTTAARWADANRDILDQLESILREVHGENEIQPTDIAYTGQPCGFCNTMMPPWENHPVCQTCRLHIRTDIETRTRALNSANTVPHGVLERFEIQTEPEPEPEPEPPKKVRKPRAKKVKPAPLSVWDRLDQDDD